MNPETHAFESRLGAVALAVVFLACVPVLLPFMTALLWGVILSYTCWPAYERLLAVLGGRRTLAAFGMAFALASIVLLPIVIVGPKLAENLQGLQATVGHWMVEGLPPPPTWLPKLPVIGGKAATYWKAVGTPNSQLMEDAKALWEAASRVLLKAGAALGRGLIHLVLSVAMAFLLFRAGAGVGARVLSTVGRIGGDRGKHLVMVAGNTIRGVVYGILGTALVQAALAGIGFFIAGVPGAGLLTFLTFFLAILPAGPVLVWLPAALWLFSESGSGWGVFMLIWGVGVSSVDNVVKPWLISRGGNMPFLLIFVGVLGGALAYGFVGVFLGPTLLAVLYRIVQEWDRGGLPPGNPAAPEA